jgi:FkbM family methyltransferase
MKKSTNLTTVRKALFRRIKLFFTKDPDRFLKKITGVVHVGANTGQEIRLYAQYGLSVVWIEPIPDVFEKLQSNLKGIPGQVALQGLVTDRDDAEYQFHLASNNGASSSILDLNLHQDIWPDVSYERTIKLHSKTLSSLLKDHNVALSDYDMLIMDTQGSELLVLKGAVPILHHFRYIKTEVPDFEAYKDCCQLKDLQLFLGQYGYGEVSRKKFATHPNGGSYYDIVYQRS